MPGSAPTAQRPDHDIAGRLRAAGLRVTAARLAVYEAVAAAGHRDAEAIGRDARARAGSVSTQAVYDSLRVLTELGLLRRIESAGHAALYETRVADNHHHVVCRRCGAVADIDCATGLAPCLTASDTHGFALDEAEVTFWGLCPDCQQDARHQGEA